MLVADQLIMKIDLVYTWVDGNDPRWLELKRHHKSLVTGCSEEESGTSRYESHDELRYSLRSVARYAPWINHIYVITADQTPEWLNTDNSKISIVSHSDIFPTEALPSFSSPAIESCMFRIEGLSEHFLYSNDDMLLAHEVTPETFFTDKGYPIVRVRPQIITRKKSMRSHYMLTVYRMQQLIKRTYGKWYPYAPHHNFDAYLKSDMRACAEAFADLWRATVYHRFRDDNDMQRFVYSLYGLAVGRAELKKVGRYDWADGVLDRLRCVRHHSYKTDSRCMALATPDYDRIMRKYNPRMFCMNDDVRSSVEDKRRVAALFNKMFPDKCEFEK